MNCNCKKEIEAKLLDRLKASAPEATDHAVELQGYGLTMNGNTMTVKCYMPALTSAQVPLKKGGSRLKKNTISMFFTYCPFCGVKA